VYQFCNTSNPFSGKIQINYRDGSELRNIPENALNLNIHNGTAWKAYKPANRDATNNFVLTSGLSCVRLNELTLTDCPAPVIQCNRDTVVNAAKGSCGIVVVYKASVVTDICGNATITQIAGLSSGAFFPVGCTKNTFVATSSSGKADTCSFTVTVKDKQPPFITQVSTNPALLWPPNHTMKNVTINYNTWDNCGAVTSSLAVSSNEPVIGTGYGDSSPDWIIVDDHHLKLRAERYKHGNGRIYTITITSTDASGNTSTQKTQVLVPRHKHGNHSKDTGDDEEDYFDKTDYLDQPLDCKVIPNPSSQYFSLQLSSASDEKIEVNLLDINGRLLANLKAVKNQTLRFGEDLRPGVYMLDVRQGEQRKTIKVIKE
jgi:hypothetical protein